MQLTRVEIEKFRAIEHLELDFTDALGRVRPITVLAGPNGIGKTSTLFAIVNALRGAFGYNTDDVPKPNDLDVRVLANGPVWTDEPTEIRVRASLVFSEDELEAIGEVFERTVEIQNAGEAVSIADRHELPGGQMIIEWRYPPERLPDGRVRPTWYVRDTDPPFALAWCWGRRLAIRGWRNGLLRDQSLRDRVGGLHLFPQDRNMADRVVGVDYLREGENGDVDADATEGSERIRRAPSVQYILKYLGDYASGRVARTQARGEPWEGNIKELFARVCAPKRYVGIKYHQSGGAWAAWCEDSGIEYPLSTAASGELVILEYLTRMSYPSPLHHSLILIDEPEVHLHPKWVRSLYLALPQINDGNQYILTTHSQELRALAAQDNALIDLGHLGDGA